MNEAGQKVHPGHRKNEDAPFPLEGFISLQEDGLLHLGGEGIHLEDQSLLREGNH